MTPKPFAEKEREIVLSFVRLLDSSELSQLGNRSPAAIQPWLAVPARSFR